MSSEILENGITINSNDTGVSAGEIKSHRKKVASLSASVKQPGFGTQFVILNSKNIDFKNEITNQISVVDKNNVKNKQTTFVSKNPKDIIWYGRIGTFANERRLPVHPDGGYWVKVSSGNAFVLAIDNDSRLYSWGSNSNGQLGLGDFDNRNTPTIVDDDTGWTDVSGGNSHSLAIKNGSLYSWGLNNVGQLGLGDFDNRNTPTQVGIDSDWQNTISNGNSSVGIKANALYSWGHNNAGQLGLGDFINRNIPSFIDNDSWEYISRSPAGSTHFLGIKNGNLYAWGNNNNGQLGLGDFDNRNTPTQVGIDSDWTSVAIGILHSSAIKDGMLFSWGNNFQGQLGLGDFDNRNMPTQVGIDSDWTSISCGSLHCVGIRNKCVYSWGNNQYGQLGLGDFDNRNTPNQSTLPCDTSELIFQPGSQHTIGIKDGFLIACGRNDSGQLGLRNNDNQNKFVKVTYEDLDYNIANDDRLTNNQFDFLNSDFGKSYESAYPVTLNQYGYLGKEFENKSFYTGSISVKNQAKSISITKNSFALPLTRTSPGGIIDGDNKYTTKRSYVYGEIIGGRNLFDISNGRSFIAGVTGGQKKGTYDYKGNIFDNYDSDDNVSPYVLLPEDNLIIACINQPAPYEPQEYLDDESEDYNHQPSTEHNIANIFKTKLSPGIGKVKIYGSYVRDNKPQQDYSKQNISSLTLHETINDDKCFDQFNVENIKSYKGGYLDNVVSYTDENVKLLNRAVIHSNVEGTSNFEGSLQKFVRLSAQKETYYDSHVPNVNEIITATGHKLFNMETVGLQQHKNKNVLVFTGDNVDEQDELKPTHHNWLYAFPFESKFSNINRSTSPRGALRRNISKTNTNINVIDSILFVDGNSDSFNGYWKKVSAGYDHTLAIKYDGTLWAWGNNDFGQLGLGNTSTIARPTLVDENTDWVEISAGKQFSLGIRGVVNNQSIDNGKLYSWGINYEGQLGHQISTASLNTPTQVGDDDDWIKVSAGEKHSLGIRKIVYNNNSFNGSTNHGHPYSWGSNEFGQLGNGNNVVAYADSPSVMYESDHHFYFTSKNGTEEGRFLEESLVGIFQISAGGNHSLMFGNLRQVNDPNIANTIILSCGDNLHGQLGRNTENNEPDYSMKPIDIDDEFIDIDSVGLGTDVVVPSAGYDHSLCIVKGNLLTWGNNDKGQLGLGDTNNRYAATGVNFLDDNNESPWRLASAGYKFTIAAKSDIYYAWGSNEYGQLGIGNLENKLLPTNLNTNGFVKTYYTNLSAGYTHGVGISRNQFDFSALNKSYIRVWGNNIFNQLGIEGKTIVNYQDAIFDGEETLISFIKNDVNDTKYTTLSDISNSNEILKLFYCFGDYYKTSINSELLKKTAYPFLNQLDIKKIENKEEKLTNHRGFKYGLINVIPQGRSAIFRSDHFGQFRDMFEGCLDSKFFEEHEDNGKIKRKIGESPIFVRFVDNVSLDPIDPSETTSLNTSINATASLPYYDGYVSDR